MRRWKPRRARSRELQERQSAKRQQRARGGRRRPRQELGLWFWHQTQGPAARPCQGLQARAEPLCPSEGGGGRGLAPSGQSRCTRAA